MRRIRATSAFLMVMALFLGLMTILLPVNPVSAADPYVPKTYGIVDCSDQANYGSAACNRISAAPVCDNSDAACFKTIQGDQPGWWLSQDDMGSLCSGTDTACLARGTSWIFDHPGANADVRLDEQVPTTTTSQPGAPAGNGTGEFVDGNPDKCAKVKNDFRYCNIVTLTNGLQFYGLMMCIAGILMSCILWALGSKGQNPGQELTGKRGLIVCVVTAFIMGAAPTLVNKLNDIGKHADTSGVTTVTNPVTTVKH